MANEIFDLRFTLKMAPVIPLGCKPTKKSVAHRLLKPDEVETIAKALETDISSKHPKDLVVDVYKQEGFHRPQYDAAIVHALMQLKSVPLKFDQPDDALSFSAEKLARYEVNFESVVQPFLEYSARLNDSQMTNEQKFRALNVLAWYMGIYSSKITNISAVISQHSVPLSIVCEDLKKSLDLLIPKPDFDFSRFGNGDDITDDYHLVAIEKAINEEILFPNRFTGSSLCFLVGGTEECITPANRKISLFKKDRAFSNSVISPYLSASQYHRESEFYNVIDKFVGEFKNANYSYLLDRGSIVDLHSGGAISEYILARAFLYFKSQGEAVDEIKQAYFKTDEYLCLSGSDIEQATEAMLGRRIYGSNDGDRDFQLKTFFKEPFYAIPDFSSKVDRAKEFINARSLLMTIKNSEFPLMVFDEHASEVYSDEGLKYGRGIRLAMELLFLSMEEDGLLQALQQPDPKRFKSILNERIIGDDFDDDGRKIDQFNALLKDAASDVLDKFTYENLDHVPRIPQNWRDFKAEWKPVAA